MSPSPVPPLPEPRPAVELRDGLPVVTVTGNLDIVTAPPLHELVTDLVESHHAHLVLDLTDVSFCDSSGLRVLIAGHKRATANGGQLRLANVPRQLRRLLRTTCLDRVLHIDTDVDEAASQLTALRTLHRPQPRRA